MLIHMQAVLDKQVVAAGSGAKPPSSSSRALGLANPNVKWSAADSARVLLMSIAMCLTHRGQEVRKSRCQPDC